MKQRCTDQFDRNVLQGAIALLSLFASTALLAEEPRPAMSSLGAGYLAPPSDASLLLSPAPPATGSAAEARDKESEKAALAMRGTPRWLLAISDADLRNPQATGALSCAAGLDIGPQTTPGLDRLLRKTIADLGLSTSVIKRKHARPRPFMVNRQPICTPDAEAGLRKDGSYPSGHSAIGYGWGLILAQLIPARANQLVARGRAFGDSRRICNVHWLSDIEEGRIAAAATVARLNADPVFRANIKAVSAELKNPQRRATAIRKPPRSLSLNRWTHPHDQIPHSHNSPRRMDR